MLFHTYKMMWIKCEYQPSLFIYTVCPEGFWGPGCTETCPVCENRGVCDKHNGSCSCPPGFMGRFCQNCKYPRFAFLVSIVTCIKQPAEKEEEEDVEYLNGAVLQFGKEMLEDGVAVFSEVISFNPWKPSQTYFHEEEQIHFHFKQPLAPKASFDDWIMEPNLSWELAVLAYNVVELVMGD